MRVLRTRIPFKNYQGEQVLIEAKLSTGEGKLYQEVEIPRQPYSDVEAEMANQLSILPNFQAWCRLINIPPAKGELQKLKEWKISTEELGVNEWNKLIAERIRLQSRMLALPKAEVERQIFARLANPYAKPEESVSSAEHITD